MHPACRSPYLPRALAIAALLLAPLPALAIFHNGGFEDGTYADWTVGGGSNPGLAGTPPFTGASVQITPGPAGPATLVGTGATDPLAPTIALPRVGQYTARLNDEGGGALVTMLRQVDVVSAADVDPSDGLPHVRFAFAPVLDDPNHAPHEQPYFYVMVRNLADGSVLFEQFAYSGQPGVQFLSGPGSWKYLEFQDVDAVLPASAIGEPIELTVVAADCSLGAHGGYVYVDGFGSAPVGGGGAGGGNPGGTPGSTEPVPALGPAALALLAGLVALLGLHARRRTA